MSLSSAFRAIACLAVVASALGARTERADAWQTSLAPSTAKKAISHARFASSAPSRVRAARQARILPLLRHIGTTHAVRTTHAAKPAARATVPPAAPAPKPAAQTAVLPNDPDWSQEWGLRQVQAPDAWALVPSSARPVVIAVIDSGVDPTQADLQGALVPGVDFADSTGSTVDQYGHGTLVAGVIAARGNNGQGIAGVCWTCLIMPVKVLDASGSGTAANVALGIRWAADHGANVINMSFVLSTPDPDVEAAIAYAHAQGVIIVAAAGNAGNSDPTYPAAYPYVVSVAATDDGDQLYPWSTFGSWVTLAAPGCTVTTALGGGFSPFCGTSAAAPLVAGLAGLAYAAGATSEAQLEAALEGSAKPLPGSVGSGRVDALQLIRQFLP